MITHRSNLAVSISSILAFNHTQDNHLENISGIRTRAIEIVNVFEMVFCWEKDISRIQKCNNHNNSHLIFGI